jgi:hypothetical protein
VQFGEMYFFPPWSWFPDKWSIWWDC